MIGFLRDLRLIPIAAVASACLLALVAADLLLNRGAPGGDTAPTVAEATTIIHAAPGVALPGEAKRSWAQQMFNFPDSTGASSAPTDVAGLPPLYPPTAAANDDIITGSVSETPKPKDDKPKTGTADAAAAGGKDGEGHQSAGAGKETPPANAVVIAPPGSPAPSAAERAILERLQERRQELDKRARELDIREGLIAEAEKRVNARLAEIKDAKAQLTTAEKQRDSAENARLKGLVTMYENMKSRDAAKIFDHLETSVLIEVASQISPRAMSEILAQMSPEAAERLTVELASRAKEMGKDPNADLPKIEGRPTTP